MAWPGQHASVTTWLSCLLIRMISIKMTISRSDTYIWSCSGDKGDDFCKWSVNFSMSLLDETVRKCWVRCLWIRTEKIENFITKSQSSNDKWCYRYVVAHILQKFLQIIARIECPILANIPALPCKPVVSKWSVKTFKRFKP